jgi:hypothetical protein
LDDEDYTEEIEGRLERRTPRDSRQRLRFFVETAISIESILVTGLVVLVVILVALLFLLWL